MKAKSESEMAALNNLYMGKAIRIVRMDDEFGGRYNGKEGEVTRIDSLGQLHGTWGGLALIPNVDEFEVIG